MVIFRKVDIGLPEKGDCMAQGRSTKIISMIEGIGTSRLSIPKSLCMVI